MRDIVAQRRRAAPRLRASQLFASSDGFEGTELLASVSNPGRYLTVDRFRDEASWRRTQLEDREAYPALDAESEGLTVGGESSPGRTPT